MNNSYFDNNNIISLEEEEEDNSYNRQRFNRAKKQANNNSKSSNSFFGKIINSFSKIGQGLKNIMSMKINYEDEDDYNPNLYDQVLKRFNNNEEINLIDAPSFMEESNIQNQSNKKNESKNESNIMMISQNDINNNNENNIRNFENSFNSFNNKNEEIINTDIEPKEERKFRIKSTFLNKKRANNRNIDILEEKDEEEKNEEENINMNLSRENNLIIKNKGENSLNSSKIIINKSNSKINNRSNNTKINNSSSMNISMRSLKSIKDEINKRREENLRSIEDMHKRYGLNYDPKKEKQIREKILEDYYKEKAKRIAEGKLKLEKEKIKREEELKMLKKRKEESKNLKTGKGTEIKYTSTKKPIILSETKNEQIHYRPNNKEISNKNNLSLSPKEIVKQPNTIPKAKHIYDSNITFGNISNSQSQHNDSKEENKKNKENSNDNINIKKEEAKPKETLPFFGFNQPQKDKNDIEKEKESKPYISLFDNSGNSGNLFNQQAGNTTTPSIFGNTNIVNEKKEIKENKGLFDNRKTSIFDGMIVKNEKTEEKKEGINFKNEKKQDDFFSSTNNLEIKNEDSISNSLFKGDNAKSIFGRQLSSEKGGIFDQNTQVSNAINQQSLFLSNKDGNTEKTLLTKNNPFVNHANSNKGSSTNLFGAPSGNENNKQEQKPNNSIFPAFSFGSSGGISSGNIKSLFG